MPQIRVWLSALFFVLFTIAAAAQPVCDLVDQAAHERIGPDQFFAMPRGTIALGGSCDEGSKLCQRYIDISNCSQVSYPLAESGRTGRLFVAINTVSTCIEDCDLVDSFLAAGLLFDHADTPDDFDLFADLTRNASQRWEAYRRAALARQACCDGNILPRLFAEAQSESSDPADFVPRTGKYWHSVFEHAVRQNVLTWSYRDFFRRALDRCGADCSIKAYLLKFQERAAADGARPSSPLLFSANVMSFQAVRLQTMAPFGDEVYENDVLIELTR